MPLELLANSSIDAAVGEAALLRIELDVGEDSERVLAHGERDAKKRSNTLCCRANLIRPLLQSVSAGGAKNARTI